MCASSTVLRNVLALCGIAAIATSCTAPGGPDRITQSQFPGGLAAMTGAGGTGSDAGITPREGTCTPLASSEVLSARSTIIDTTAHAPEAETYLTSDLFAKFKNVCGGCHVESSLGGFAVTENNFATKVDATALAFIESDDSAVFMPPLSSPNGMAWSVRKTMTTDPVYQLATLLELWINQGRPTDAFTLPADETNQSASPGYALSADLAGALTNIGSCVPNKELVGTSADAMDQMDTFFAQTSTLPLTLDKTDLVTLDSAQLAKTGVISYAPTYPLWTDDAGKMRYVRVPRGQSIVFDKATQQFQIPPNTRFYKTFLKQVVDASGKMGYRKIETRLIVSRPDTMLADGTVQQNAVYGTYLWNDDESQATLLTDPLRDGKPFADRIFTIILDEAKAQAIADTKPGDLASAIADARITRHYAVPGAQRCVQCHMGSPSKSFVLGFTPLQVARRATGTGGTYEPAMGDELTQLQRLIDYGVVTGVTSPDDVLGLEKSQGARAPRTPEELNAQAYMVGNCAHCHNPRGFPTTKLPELANVLNFLPGAAAGQGIFQFPLETVSPVRKRGITQDTDIPYITPALYDIPNANDLNKIFCPAGYQGACGLITVPNPSPTATDPDVVPTPLDFIVAPWRSLIFRNTDTPYDYFDDHALFPHMPLNTPGYDCRVASLMGDWMTSIPARLKDPTKIVGALPSVGPAGNPVAFGAIADTDPQPYVEVHPTDPDYEAAKADAAARLDAYHQGYRYKFCPPSYTSDIVDPVIAAQVSRGVPVTPDIGVVYDPNDPDKVVMPTLTPLRPDYINFDDTDPPGDWFPRRPDWDQALISTDTDAFIAAAVTNNHLQPSEVEDLRNVIDALRSVQLTPDVRASLLAPVPYGLWTQTPGCNFSGVKTAATFAGPTQPRWMTLSPPAASAPVYVESAGAAVFTTICFNCHGVLADSKGLLADEITSLTGGDARVADFRDGLFGPVAQPGANRARVFGPGATQLGGGVTSDDLGARYMAWMSLGGTVKHLPQAVLFQVSQAPVLGQFRSAALVGNGTADMLQLGLALCEQIALSQASLRSLPVSDFMGRGDWSWGAHSALIDTNGDAEMWLKLCNLGNRPIVRTVQIDAGSNGGKWSATTSPAALSVTDARQYWATDTSGADVYGANPVMDHLGNLHTGITPDNDFPLCVPKPADPTERQLADQFLAQHKVSGNVIPYCPDGFVTAARQLQIDPDTNDATDGRKWAARGAINAALSVFLYLDDIERNPTHRQPLYNQCNLLSPSP